MNQEHTNSNGQTEVAGPTRSGTVPASWNAIQDYTRDAALLGFVVTWRLNGMTVPVAEVEDAYGRAGLLDYRPADPSPRLALRRAIEAAVRANRVLRQVQNATGIDPLTEAVVETDGKLPDREMIRTIPEPNSEWHVYALVTEHHNIQELSLRHATRVRFRVHKKTGQLIVATTATGDIESLAETASLAEQIQRYYDHFRIHFTSRDISASLKHIVGDCGSIMLRPEGGAYFVPIQWQVRLDLVQEMVDALAERTGGEAYFLALGVPDSARQRGYMSRAAHQAYLDRLEQMGGELDRLTSSDADARAIGHHLMLYSTLQADVQNYVDLLGIRQDEVVFRIESLSERARAALLRAMTPEVTVTTAGS